MQWEVSAVIKSKKKSVYCIAIFIVKKEHKKPTPTSRKTHRMLYVNGVLRKGQLRRETKTIAMLMRKFRLIFFLRYSYIWLTIVEHWIVWFFIFN